LRLFGLSGVVSEVDGVRKPAEVDVNLVLCCALVCRTQVSSGEEFGKTPSASWAAAKQALVTELQSIVSSFSC
jgi:hypothetical protein